MEYFDITGSSTSMFRYDEGLKLIIDGRVPRESFDEIQSVLTEKIRLIDSGSIFMFIILCLYKMFCTRYYFGFVLNLKFNYEFKIIYLQTFHFRLCSNQRSSRCKCRRLNRRV